MYFIHIQIHRKHFFHADRSPLLGGKCRTKSRNYPPCWKGCVSSSSRWSSQCNHWSTGLPTSWGSGETDPGELVEDLLILWLRFWHVLIYLVAFLLSISSTKFRRSVAKTPSRWLVQSFGTTVNAWCEIAELWGHICLTTAPSLWLGIFDGEHFNF